MVQQFCDGLTDLARLYIPATTTDGATTYAMTRDTKLAFENDFANMAPRQMTIMNNARRKYPETLHTSSDLRAQLRCIPVILPQTLGFQTAPK